MSAALGLRDFGDFSRIPTFPDIDLNMVLHGEEEIEIIKPLKGDQTKYICEQRFLDF
jgi:hypothetical protein